MNNEKLVSILVASYNQEKYIIDCLESIRHQTYRNIELLIADDCSIDNTYNIAQEWVGKYGEQFNRCESVKNHQNLGIPRNYNSLIKKAKGEYIKLIAADDIILDNGIEIAVEYLEQHKEATIVFGNSIIIGGNNHYPLTIKGDETLFYSMTPKYGACLVKELLTNDYIAAPTVMMRIDTITQYGLFREDLAFEDWEYWLRISKCDGIIGYVSSPIVAYRIHDSSSSHVKKGEQEEKRFRKTLESEKRIYKEYQSFVEKKTLNIFWNRRIEICIENNYRKTLKEILKTEHFRINGKNSIKLLLLYSGLYSVIIKIIRRTRGII